MAAMRCCALAAASLILLSLGTSAGAIICNVDADCPAPMVSCNLNMSECTCPRGQYLSTDGTRCLGDKECIVTSDCQAVGSTCNGTTGTCSCPPGSFTSYDGAFCIIPEWECSDAYLDCINIDAVCEDGHCRCPDGRHPGGGGFHCFIDDLCTSHQDCSSVPHTYCNGRRCVCEEGLHLSTNRTACLREGQCEMLADCPGVGALCTNGTCGCPPGRFLSNDSRACLTLGECTSHEDCDGPVNGSCSHNKCVCPGNSSLAYNGTVCLSYADYELPCVTDGQCTGLLGLGARCGNGSCTCRSGYMYKGHVCALVIDHVGMPCHHGRNETCHLASDADSQHVSCTAGKCECDAGYQASAANTSCEAVPPPNPGPDSGFSMRLFLDTAPGVHVQAAFFFNVTFDEHTKRVDAVKTTA